MADPWAKFKMDDARPAAPSDPWARFKMDDMRSPRVAEDRSMRDLEQINAGLAKRGRPQLGEYERGMILPFGGYVGGPTELAVPSILKDVTDSLYKLMSADYAGRNQPLDDSPTPRNDIGGDVFNAMTMSPSVSPARGAGAWWRARVGTETPAVPPGQLAAQRNVAIADDLAAFERQGVRPFGPSFSQGPMASTAKQLSETPLMGSPVKNALDESLSGVAEVARRIADDLAPGADALAVGSTLQRGVDRFRQAGIREIEPGVLEAQGVQPTQVARPPVLMGQAQERRAVEAGPVRLQNEGGVAETQRGVQVPAIPPANQPRVMRRTADDLSDQEVAALVRAPAQDTSFAVRQEALYEQAWRRLPARFRADGSANPERLPVANTRGAMTRIDNEIANQISGQGRIDGELAERLRNPRAHFSLGDLRSIRTEIGRALGNFGIGDARLDRTQLRELYGAVSRDIEVGLQDIANRAHINSRSGLANRAEYVSPQDARMADRALYEFRRADRYTRAGMDRMESFLKLVRADHPEQAAQTMVRAALGQGNGDLNLLRTARAALRPEEWNGFSSLVIRNLGAPVGSARGTTQEIGFSVSSFLTRYQNMSPEARTLLFSGEHQGAINDLVRMASRLANVEALANSSRSGTNLVNLGGLLTGGSLMATGQFEAALGVAAAGGAAAYLFSRPSYARWAATYAQLRDRAQNAPGEVADRLGQHVARLARMADADPALAPVYLSISTEYQQQQRGGRQ